MVFTVGRPLACELELCSRDINVSTVRCCMPFVTSCSSSSSFSLTSPDPSMRLTFSLNCLMYTLANTSKTLEPPSRLPVSAIFVSLRHHPNPSRNASNASTSSCVVTLMLLPESSSSSRSRQAAFNGFARLSRDRAVRLFRARFSTVTLVLSGCANASVRPAATSCRPSSVRLLASRMISSGELSLWASLLEEVVGLCRFRCEDG